MIACLVFLSLSFVDQRDEVKMVRLGAEGKVQGSGDTDDGVDSDTAGESSLLKTLKNGPFIEIKEQEYARISVKQSNEFEL